MRYPLELALAPSRRMLILVAAIHLVAAIAFLFSSLSWLIRLLALLVLAGSLRAAVRNERAKAGTVLVLDNSGTLATTRAGDPRFGRPERSCTDFGWAVWLQWRMIGVSGHPSGPRETLMLLPDNLPDGTWRGLRIWLKHKALATEKPDTRRDKADPKAGPNS
jgi:hypothetical protein